MDYEKIVKGRRRNWDPLKPDEVRQREKEEERARKEAERASGKRETSFQRLRRRFREAAEAEDRARFNRALRQSIILGGSFLLFVGLWITVSAVTRSRAFESLRSNVSENDAAIRKGLRVFRLNDPAGAFASWRSAWLREDYDDLVKTFSQTYLRRSMPSGDASKLIDDYIGIAATGGMESNITLAGQLADADPMIVPRKPWRNGQLALFQSQTVVSMGIDKQYTLAFAYDANSQNWRFADMRESQFFSVKWLTEADIKPLKAGVNATVFDERGSVISRQTNAME